MKKILFFFSIAFSLFVINNLLHSMYDIWQKHALVDQVQQDVQREKEENGRLKQQLKVVKSEEFVEEEARNKLQLAKPGEIQIIMPAVTPSATSGALLGKTKDSTGNHVKEWLSLFLDL